MVPSAAGTVALYDRFLTLTNNQSTGGGPTRSSRERGARAGTDARARDDAGDVHADGDPGDDHVQRAGADPAGHRHEVRPALSARRGRPLRGGTVVNHYDGTLTYRPPLTRATTDSFRYTVRTRLGAASPSGR